MRITVMSARTRRSVACSSSHVSGSLHDGSGYTNIGDYHGGAYECLHVSPYSKSASNVMPRCSLFSKIGVLPSVGQVHSTKTPAQLVIRQHSDKQEPQDAASQALWLTSRPTRYARTYGTNLFPFIKDGALSARLPTRDLVRARRSMRSSD